ncbi:MAG: 4Fe-4S dicluster domain-containing protein [Deltaproteobacteria bacterium]|jgi:NAD-dependent dihydropyrimidine dehydrogenase PreA subunit|nr:4Fe-4S dicluster domain-containing protein [Deltaproteobacteria bacterium]
MKPSILAKNSLCVGCNKCTRACPVESANVALQDSSGRIFVTIDQSKCLACGSCIEVCSHGARRYRDDLGQFLKDLEAGKKIAVIADTSVRTSFPEYRRIFRWLADLGVTSVLDGILGYNLFEWACVSYMRRFRPFSAIVSHCPVVTEYLRIYRPELLPRLVPVPAPLALQGIWLRERIPEGHAVAALTPCIAYAKEFEETGAVAYNITFRKLLEHLSRSGIELPPEGARPGPAGQETLVEDITPCHPPLRESFSRRLGPEIRVDGARGKSFYVALDEYAAAPLDTVPPVFATAFCDPWCDLGPGGRVGNTFFHISSVKFADLRAEAARSEPPDSDFRAFDEELELESYLKERSPLGPVNTFVPEKELNNAFRLLGMTPDVSSHFNCGFCGSHSCLDMARKIALRTNLPMNCVTKMRQVSEESHRKVTAYIELIRNVSENLLNRAGGDVTGIIEHALLSLCYSLDAFSASLWKNAYDKEERPTCTRVASFPTMLLNHGFNLVTMEDPPGWLETLMEGNSLIRSKSEMSNSELQKFIGRNVNSIVLTPVIAQGEFWGFISLLKQEDQPVTEQDLSVLTVCNNLLASFMINMELNVSLLSMDDSSI